ncbi:MAG TPA: hypothetical protein VJ953_16560 [Saprospiraceae bacterium]|nr:hypothetical protein [Saprospiraceae bacterium]
MKRSLFFILPLAVLGLVFASITVSYERNVVKDYDTFTEFLHHTCNGTSAIGGTCSATCRDAADCSCTSGFFTCSCSCTIATEDQTSIEVEPLEQTITPAPLERWEKVQTIISEENTAVAKNLSKKLMKTYELGQSNQIEEFLAHTEELEREMMNLQPKTLQKLVVAFS